ncbi:MAG TPA: 1-(5-phosphoribosyl)-5-[(5-phosphoribosylamino)methylideneamino]imidazole-4-carboxamide isomerase [Acidimicrobiia bacterium]|nr:1-(5-phosphoribosyl)-5-[(5-phosphoribosylamino)methylideneamino]imidazole-4-carboxamide isomerase [Acidimicrobiia bacterium]
MDLYPAIDIRDGKVVQLQQGDYARETVYSADPVAVARKFDQAGVRWIHVVDLDAARDGGNPNLAVIGAVCAAVTARVQTGGGVRSLEDALARFKAGVTRVVIGSAAVEHPELVDELAASHPERIAVGLDARGTDVAIHGWADATGADLVTLAKRFDRPGVGALIVTDIARDGMLSGPAIDQLHPVLAAVDAPVIASGGVSSADDLRGLARLEIGGRRLAGAIAGTSIYEGRFTVAEGIAACSPSA